MNKQGVRIISLEAKTIYKSILENGESVGYVLPDKKNPIYFLLFKILLIKNYNTYLMSTDCR